MIDEQHMESTDIGLRLQLVYELTSDFAEEHWDTYVLSEWTPDTETLERIIEDFKQSNHIEESVLREINGLYLYIKKWMEKYGNVDEPDEEPDDDSQGSDI